jgi:hypothetical protein
MTEQNKETGVILHADNQILMWDTQDDLERPSKEINWFGWIV